MKPITKKQILSRFNKSVLERLMNEFLSTEYDGKPRYTETGRISREKMIELINSAKVEIEEAYISKTGEQWYKVRFPYICISRETGNIYVHYSKDNNFRYTEQGKILANLRDDIIDKGIKSVVDCFIKHSFDSDYFVKDSTAISIRLW